MTKTCTQCHHNKSTDDFYKHPTTVDKLLPVCKQCQKERSKLYQQTHREVQRRSNQKWREKSKSPYGSWKKNCPGCGAEQVYTTKYALQKSLTDNWKCHKCKYHLPPSPKIIWKRNCPVCGKGMIYVNKGNLKRAIEQNSRCCEAYNYPRTPSQKELIKKMAEKRKECVGPKHHFFGKHHTEKTKEKISSILTGKKRLYPVSETTRLKHRTANLRKMETKGIPVKTDVGSEEWFEKYNNDTNSNFKPKRFFGVGYDADGYDPDKHIWIEYDTPYHSFRCQRERDIIRERRIIKYFEDIGEPLVEFKRVLAYNGEELITKYRGYGY